MRKTFVSIAAFFLFSSSLAAHADIRFSANFEAELRYYPSQGLIKEQKDLFASLAFNPQMDWQDEQRNHIINLELYGRDSRPKGNRSYADIREAYYLYAGEAWQIQAGISRVFWGVVESNHIVDVVNQSDILASATGTEKLGQPMLSFSLEQAWGNMDFFLLPYFRKREFPDGPERFRLGLSGIDNTFNIEPVFSDKRVYYQSSRQEKHVDVALRWNHYWGGFDMAVSAFSGTSREPLPILTDLQVGPKAIFSSYYEQLQQLGVELQYVYDGWAFKFESASRWQQSGNYHTVVSGFEYTFSDIAASSADVGLLVEYLWHNRKDISIEKPSLEVLDPSFTSLAAPFLRNNRIPSSYLSPFNNDIFLGMRFALNNINGSYFLAGVIVDADDQTTAASFEGSTRLVDNLNLSLNVYVFSNASKESAFYAFRKDDQIELKLQWYF